MDPKPGTLAEDEDQQRSSGDEYIHAEKSANAIGEELMEKQRHIGAVLGQPRDKLPIWQNRPEKTQNQLDRFQLHLCSPAVRFRREEAAHGPSILTPFEE
jgi:hypothetical protein